MDEINIENTISIVMSSCLNKEIRKEYLTRSIKSIRENLGNDIEILIGFDKFGDTIDGCKCYTHEKGLGHSFNWGISNAKNDFVLQTEDDWIIGVDKDIFVNDLKNKIKILNEFGGFFKFTNLDDKEYRAGKKQLEYNKYEFLEWNKTNRFMFGTNNMYRYSNQPHIKKRNFHDDIKHYYVENKPPNVVELDMCYKFQISNNRVFSYPSSIFLHIGDESSRK